MYNDGDREGDKGKDKDGNKDRGQRQILRG